MAKSLKTLTKTEVLTNIAETTQLTRKQVASVFNALSDEIGSWPMNGATRSSHASLQSSTPGAG